MAQRNVKTVKLDEGKHESPEDGACVVELASMLADEPFSDKPGSVSPVIREFLRDYNDDLNYRRRQDLHAVAAHVVGTAGNRGVERGRAEALALVRRMVAAGEPPKAPAESEPGPVEAPRKSEPDRRPSRVG